MSKIIESKNIEKAIKAVIPDNFKILSDKNSNGYKYFNILIGGELDSFESKINDIIFNSTIDELDLSQTEDLYETYYTGSITDQSVITGDGIQLYPINESQLNDYIPTRLDLLETINLSGITSGIVGLEYNRTTKDGSGVLIVNIDSNNSLTRYNYNLDRTGNIISYSGEKNGILSKTLDDLEVLTPMGEDYLKREYPITRTILDDSGNYRTFDHYEPYNGFYLDGDTPKAWLGEYTGSKYYNDNGEYVYHQTCLNNPNGSGVFTTEIFDLEYTPIDGTIKIYDIDNLNYYGDANEIPNEGKQVFEYTDLVNPLNNYIGYNNSFTNLDGKICKCTRKYITSWEPIYLSGVITNQIKIINPIARYAVVYDYKIYNSASCITTNSSSKFIKIYDGNPIQILDTDNVQEVNFEFSRQPSSGNFNNKNYITFDGLKKRPNTYIKNLKINVPITQTSSLKNNILFQAKKYDETYIIGYSNKLIIDPIKSKSYKYDFYFNIENEPENPVGICKNTSIILPYTNVGSTVLKTNYENYTGRSIICNSPYAFKYYLNDNEASIYTDASFRFKFRMTDSTITLLETNNSTINKKIKLIVNYDSIKIYTETNMYFVNFTKFINFDINYYDLIIRSFITNDNKTDFELFLKRPEDEFHIKYDLYLSDDSITVDDNNYTYFCVNSTVDIGNISIYGEIL